MNIGIYIYDNAEVLDFSGPFEVFATAGRLVSEKPALNVFLVAEHMRPVQARGGFSVNPHFCFLDHPVMEVLIVAGGVHAEELRKNQVIAWVAHQAKQTAIIASVCTGAFILAKAGVLNELKVATHWEDAEALQWAYPRLEVITDRRWVDQGHVITSGGISAGIDMSLHLLSRLISTEMAEKTAYQMEYRWLQDVVADG